MAGVSNTILAQKIDALSKKSDERAKVNEKRFLLLEEKYETLNQDIHRGNGEKGLKERISLVERDIEQIKEDTDEIKEYQIWANKLIIGTLFTSVVGILTTIILFFVLK